MHEMSICEGIMQVVEEQAKLQSFAQVNTIRLEIGPLAGVELEALRFSFDVVTRDTIADGCRLDVIELPAEAWCMACAKTVTIEQRYDACPDCGGFQLQLTQGEELRIKDMEVN